MSPLYSRRPARALRQIVADVVMLAWCVGWWLLGHRVGTTLHALAAPGEDAAARLREAAGQVEQGAADADRLPVVGRGLAEPLSTLAEALRDLAGAGDAQLAQAHQLAQWTTVALIVVPIALGLAFWLPPRLRFVRQSLQLNDFRGSASGESVLALRALTSQPLGRLRRVHPDPARAWQQHDATVVRALANLQLREHGVRTTSTGTRPRPGRTAVDEP